MSAECRNTGVTLSSPSVTLSSTCLSPKLSIVSVTKPGRCSVWTIEPNESVPAAGRFSFATVPSITIAVSSTIVRPI